MDFRIFPVMTGQPSAHTLKNHPEGYRPMILGELIFIPYVVETHESQLPVVVHESINYPG
ncbi:MAG: hypothetical protein EBT57_06810 [Verrucomicrobia bacterium]|nr:hypothetical protein [Verrucomicrobiota bacterium]